MMIIGIGVDIVEIERIERVLARRGRFLERVYTPEEVAQCLKKAQPAASLAARFAAKEAVFKALGGGWGLGWRSVAITAGEEGTPQVHLQGAAAIRSLEIGVKEVKVSLTHSKNTACAVAVALGGLPV